MGDRLTDGDRYGQHGELGADVGEHLLLAALGARQIDVDLGVVDAFGMLVELGAAGAPPQAPGLGNLHDEPLGKRAQAIGFGKGDAGVVLQVDEDGALVERGQKGSRQQHGTDASCQHTDGNSRKYRAWPAEGPIQEPGVARLEAANEGAVAAAMARRRR